MPERYVSPPGDTQTDSFPIKTQTTMSVVGRVFADAIKSARKDAKANPGQALLLVDGVPAALFDRKDHGVIPVYIAPDDGTIALISSDYAVAFFDKSTEKWIPFGTGVKVVDA